MVMVSCLRFAMMVVGVGQIQCTEAVAENKTRLRPRPRHAAGGAGEEEEEGSSSSAPNLMHW